MGRRPVLAVDGGNSKTVAVVADAGGAVVGRGRGGNGDIYGARDPDRAIGEIVAAAEASLATAGVRSGDVVAAAFSLAGADWPEDVELLRTELHRRLGLACEPVVVNDALGCIRVASPEWEGVAVACGTFNAVGARRSDGRAFHLGFWPDRTGGFDLAHEALKAVYREGLDLGPSTALTPRLLGLFDHDGPLDLLHAFTRRGSVLGFTELSRIPPVLLDVAHEGDPVAVAIVVQSGTWLGDEARVAAARIDLVLDGAALVLTGGVLAHPSPLLTETILAHLPGVVPMHLTVPPVVGALLLAFDRTGTAADPDALGAQLRS